MKYELTLDLTVTLTVDASDETEATEHLSDIMSGKSSDMNVTMRNGEVQNVDINHGECRPAKYPTQRLDHETLLKFVMFGKQ